MMTYQPSNAAKPAAAAPVEPQPLSEEDQSKDAFFVQLGELAEAMIARHGKDFAMGTLLLSARFIAENRPLIRRSKAPGP
ncbi:hypothetical protein [Lichenifustis flavocetrariae]|uniref:Uncharacterized protein n=1 Tax=Lichenifustis flavocetrariae TaxID=2949735 RepID=A0AA41YXK4_9HYPH|nr:hypothetical protein [Lichenifustis flavocetrariae]MCW6508863.1 hypothetical protein [Lichenifustis flavocetrariae]